MTKEERDIQPKVKVLRHVNLSLERKDLVARWALWGNYLFDPLVDLSFNPNRGTWAKRP